ncbi:MAG: LysM peptidoglycan-binding domain-containing protein, partial [Candidatus Obscuribacterales bacterium]|nr:LysM peptidoglycan-binding domain-containing protein [Candidatus Obscuribacterales bacterium]
FKGGGKGREFTVSEDGSLNYEVQKGDTLWSISKDVLKAKLNREPNSGEIFAQITEIASASGITNPNKIYPMDKIKVPQAKTNEADSAEIPKSITDQLSDTQKTDKPYLTNLAKMATVLTTKFNNFDANKDRQITPNEYQAVMDSYANLAGKETDPTKKKVMQTVHQVLEQAKVLFPRTASRTHAISPEYLAQSINDLTILSK